MVFNSLEFLLFFPIVTVLYFLLSHTYRWPLLLTASAFFYGYFKWEYLLILVFTIFVDFFAGLWIEKTQGKAKKWALIASILANVGVLAYFKYADFILDNINAVVFKLGHEPFNLLEILLPIGLSFHTFQAMSYTFEVYKGTLPAERNLGRYALYVMFYPQLVAGPIERPQNVIPQFFIRHKFDFQRAKSGLRLMLWGMFKKVVIADRLAVFVDLVYDNPQAYSGTPLVMATIFFAIQIFCDFSGYSDIALGAARVMGFKLMKNFDRPYFSKSISEFWRRWHISLSTWFRDYLYIPLGGNRKGPFRRYLNLILVFMISGLWHGASWNFVIWGTLHGVYLVVGQWSKGFQDALYGLIPQGFLRDLAQNLSVLFLVGISWVFFRAEGLDNALYILKNAWNQSSHTLAESIQLMGQKEFIVGMAAIFLMESVHWLQRGKDLGVWAENLPKWKQWAAYYLLFIGVIFFGVYNNTQFIYFQF